MEEKLLNSALTLPAAFRRSPSEDAVDLAKFASCVAVIGSPMVGRAALELATSFAVGYKHNYIDNLTFQGKTKWQFCNKVKTQ